MQCRSAVSESGVLLVTDKISMKAFEAAWVREAAHSFMAIERLLGTEVEDELVDGYRESYSRVKITPTKQMVIDRLFEVDVGPRKAEQQDILEKLQDPAISYNSPICGRAVGVIMRFHDPSIQVSGMSSRVCPQCLEIVPRQFAVCAKCLVKLKVRSLCRAAIARAQRGRCCIGCCSSRSYKASAEMSEKYAASNVPMVPEVDMDVDEDIVMAGAITAPANDEELVDAHVTDEDLLELRKRVLGIRLIRKGFTQWRSIQIQTEEHQLQCSFKEGKRYDCPGIWPLVEMDPATNRPRPIMHDDCVNYYAGEKGRARDYVDMKYASYEFGRFVMQIYSALPHLGLGEKDFNIEFDRDPKKKEKHDTLGHAMISRLMGQVFNARYYSYFRGDMGYDGYFHINPSGMATRDSGNLARVRHSFSSSITTFQSSRMTGTVLVRRTKT